MLGPGDHSNDSGFHAEEKGSHRRFLSRGRTRDAGLRIKCKQ